MANTKAFPDLKAADARQTVNTRWFLMHDGEVAELTRQQVSLTQSNTMQAFSRQTYGRRTPLTILTTHRGGYELSGYIMPKQNPLLLRAVKSKKQSCLLWYQEDAGLFEMADYVISSATRPMVDEQVYILNATLTMDGRQMRGWMATATGLPTNTPDFDIPVTVPANIMQGIMVVNQPASARLETATIRMSKGSTNVDFGITLPDKTGLAIVKSGVLESHAALAQPGLSLSAKDPTAFPNTDLLFGVGYQFEYEVG